MKIETFEQIATWIANANITETTRQQMIDTLFKIGGYRNDK